MQEYSWNFSSKTIDVSTDCSKRQELVQDRSMTTPTPSILATIQTILVDHNVLEEGGGGLYETCDALAGLETVPTLAALSNAPDVTVTVSYTHLTLPTSDL